MLRGARQQPARRRQQTEPRKHGPAGGHDRQGEARPERAGAAGEPVERDARRPQWCPVAGGRRPGRRRSRGGGGDEGGRWRQDLAGPVRVRGALSAPPPATVTTRSAIATSAGRWATTTTAAPSVGELLHGGHHGLLGGGVEMGAGLVEQGQASAVAHPQDGAGECHALALPGREGAGGAVEERGDPEGGGDVGDLLLACRGGAQHEVRRDRVGGEHRALGDPGEGAGPCLVVELGEGHAVDGDRAARGRDAPAQHVDEGALAAARGADERHHLAGRNVQRRVVGPLAGASGAAPRPTWSQRTASPSGSGRCPTGCLARRGCRAPHRWR